MKASDANAVGPREIAGIPLSHWAYAARIWAAMMLALLVSFWLQLDSAASSATTVAILAQPRRGDALRKATFRFGATIVGVIASIVITALFSQTRDLFVVAYAVWIGFAVYLSKFYDGSRAYGFVLAGYTVALIAVYDIDTPQDVFLGGLARLATITVGIASIALVNDVLGAPAVYPGLRERLHQAHCRTVVMVRALIGGGSWRPQDVVELLATLTATRNEIYAIAAESDGGRHRSAAAASAVVAMVEAINRARALAVLSRGSNGIELRAWRQAIEDEDRTAIEAAIDVAMVDEASDADDITRLVVVSNLVSALRLASSELAAMDAGRAPTRRVAMPIHRDRELARRGGIRVFFGIIVSALLLIQSSWPMTSISLGVIGLLAGLGAQTPDPAAFGKGAVIAMTLAFTAAGVTEYIFIDGADAFPLLAIGLAPSIFTACFLVLGPKTAPIGSLMLVFILIFFSPSNPQSYNPETYILTGALALAAAVIFLVFTTMFIPVTDRDRRRWMVNRARKDLLDARLDQAAHTPEEMTFLAADRIVALSRFGIGAPSARIWRLAYALVLSNLTLVIGRGHAELTSLSGWPVDPAVIVAARDAFANLDARGLRASGYALRLAASGSPTLRPREVAAALSDLTLVAALLENERSTLRHLRVALL